MPPLGQRFPLASKIIIINIFLGEDHEAFSYGWQRATTTTDTGSSSSWQISSQASMIIRERSGSDLSKNCVNTGNTGNLGFVEMAVTPRSIKRMYSLILHSLKAVHLRRLPGLLRAVGQCLKEISL